MITLALFVFGLCLGSFVNALVWRLHEQEEGGSRKARSKKNKELSIVHGRSMCPHCRHTLAARDLVPVVSWLSLKGKCRYCGKAISWQYPLVELATAAFFVASYGFWPLGFDARGVVTFVGWLVLLTGFMALLVYDVRWMLLPNRLTAPMAVIAGVFLVVDIVIFDGGWSAALQALLAVVVGGGLFWLLFQLSQGKWIGGGDVKLGAVIGLTLQQPSLVLLVIFLASVLGTLVAVPLLATGKATRKTQLPFGPYLILATIVVRLFGEVMVSWYSNTFLFY